MEFDVKQELKDSLYEKIQNAVWMNEAKKKSPRRRAGTDPMYEENINELFDTPAGRKALAGYMQSAQAQVSGNPRMVRRNQKRAKGIMSAQTKYGSELSKAAAEAEPPQSSVQPNAWSGMRRGAKVAGEGLKGMYQYGRHTLTGMRMIGKHGTAGISRWASRNPRKAIAAGVLAGAAGLYGAQKAYDFATSSPAPTPRYAPIKGPVPQYDGSEEPTREFNNTGFRFGGNLREKKELKDSLYEKIQNAIWMNEEVEKLNEIGDTLRGRQFLRTVYLPARSAPNMLSGTTEKLNAIVQHNNKSNIEGRLGSSKRNAELLTRIVNHSIHKRNRSLGYVSKVKRLLAPYDKIDKYGIR